MGLESYEVIGITERGAYTKDDYPHLPSLRPKKAYFRTVSEMERGIDHYLLECQQKKIPPTISGFEDRFGTLNNYEARKGRSWKQIADRVRSRLNTAFIEYAFTHPKVQKLSAMKLAHIDEFRPIRQEVAVEETHTFDFSRIREIADQLDAEDSIDVEEVAGQKLLES